MRHSLLLPNGYKKAGWIILVPMLIIGLALTTGRLEAFPWLEARVYSFFPGAPSGSQPVFGCMEANLTNTIVGVLFIAGCLLVGFSKEKQEDEFIAGLRLKALLWAVMVNYIILIAAFLVFYDFGFLWVMVYNMYTVLLLFIIRFHYLLYRTSKSLTDEKQD